MKDDITSRELELVDALLKALMENATSYRIVSSDPEEEIRLKEYYDEGYGDGYQTAQDVIAEVLKQRGFDVEPIEMESYE